MQLFGKLAPSFDEAEFCTLLVACFADIGELIGDASVVPDLVLDDQVGFENGLVFFNNVGDVADWYGEELVFQKPRPRCVS